MEQSSLITCWQGKKGEFAAVLAQSNSATRKLGIEGEVSSKSVGRP